MNEYEKKIILTEEEYLDILSLLGDTNPTDTQANYYYDTLDLLMDKQDITCRIRCKNGICEATMKTHDPIEKDKSEEKNCGHVDSLINNQFTEMGLELLGQLVTHRIVLFENNIIKAVIDKNEYASTIDYELEIEYKEGFEKSAEIAIKCLSFLLFSEKKSHSALNLIDRINKKPFKSKRFFKRIYER